MSEETTNETEVEESTEATLVDSTPEQAEQPETKAEGEGTKTLLSDDGGDGASAEEAVPEKYDFKAPEDFEVTEEVQRELDVFSEAAKTAGLKQDQYQQLVDWQIKQGRESAIHSETAYQERIDEWGQSAKADEEFGGANLKDNLLTANQAIEKFSTPELKAILGKPSASNPNGLGIGNHPEVVRLFYRIGKAIGDSDLITGSASQAESDQLERMYPSMFNENQRG